MSRIRGKDTTPERIVRSLLHRLGYRFRLNIRIPISEQLKIQNSKLKTATPRFVRPDIILPKHRVAIFVHGCFWHRHKHCKNCTTPTHRREWWLKKLNGNTARDKIHQRSLRQLGWHPVVIWECQTEKPKILLLLARKLVKLTG
jgi:DNA mismatch endonuclease (patch repair protein)